MTSFDQFLEDFRQSRLGILIDDQGPFRAVLVGPAQDITTEETNRLLLLTGGLTFVALSPERIRALLLEPMTRPQLHDAIRGRATSPQLVQQLVSVEAREGVSTGISAQDRATTLRILGHPTPQPRALVTPGHIFPVTTREGGVIVKTALAEGALDIVKAAGFVDAAIFIDLLSSSGDLCNESATLSLASTEQIPTTTLSQLIAHRLEREPLITRVAESTIPTALAGDVRAIVYRSRIHEVEHVAIVKGEISPDRPVLVRVQAESTLGDVFSAGVSSPRGILQSSLKAIGERGSGVLLYLRRPHIEAEITRNQESTPPVTSSIVMREYGIGAQILRDLGVSQIELLTSMTRPLVGLPSFGLTIVAQHPLIETGSPSEISL